MQYQVPQFIEVEDKIFGPLTFKQFAYLAGAGGACLLFWSFLPWWFAALLSLPFVGLGLALAFFRVNGKPFIEAAEHAIRYYFGRKLYLWQQRKAGSNISAPLAPTAQTPTLPSVSESKLKDLAWSLNIKDREKLGVASKTPSGFEI